MDDMFETSEVDVSKVKASMSVEVDFDKKEEDEDFVPEAQPMEIVEEDDKFEMSSDDHRQKILDLKNSVQVNYVEICKLLYQAQKKRRYESWGYASFKDYAQKELGFKYARAKSLSDLGLVAYREPTVFDKMIPLGIDKAYEIKRVANSENVDEWIEKGKQLSADDLKKEVRSHIMSLVPKDPQEALELEDRARETPVIEQLHRRIFNFSYEQLQTLNQALVWIKQSNPEITRDEEAIQLICADFIGSSTQEHGNEFAIKAVQKYEQFYPIKVIVISDPQRDLAAQTSDSNEILYGLETLKDIIKKELSS